MLTRLYCAVYLRALMLSETLRRLTLRAVCACMALISPVVMADGDLGDLAKGGAEGAKVFQTSGITVIQVFGFFAVGGALLSVKAMKNNPQIRPWMIWVAFIVGLLCLGITEIIKRGMVQFNLNPVTVS
ncbi:conjugal transfer protein (plasmid) [Pantoea sp. JZ29]|uniref:DUF6750 family protein n=1 Tax=Pantoea sp. JZ29 TaxID=2654192 RepID=UPI002B467B14|nr:DUF6750 family protein [Pantoea sp. JZ29]WRH23482.1 conjugal transfer protein [Pantoea sp. JZ29]